MMLSDSDFSQLSNRLVRQSRADSSLMSPTRGNSTLRSVGNRNIKRCLAIASSGGAAERGQPRARLFQHFLGLLLLCSTFCLVGRLASAEVQELFACRFPNSSLAKPWKTIGGTWQVLQGVLKQVDAGLDDPSKAVLIFDDRVELSSGIELTAKLRLDTWKGDDQARAGIGLCCDPETGCGLNLAFHRGQLQFVHDYVAWAPGCAFSYQTGVWYWMKLCKTSYGLRGKAWRDGEPEPDSWMVEWTACDPSLVGYPALLGSSGGPGVSGTTVSFAECRVVRVGPSPTAFYTKKSTWQETMSASFDSLKRQSDAAAGPAGQCQNVQTEILWR